MDKTLVERRTENMAKFAAVENRASQNMSAFAVSSYSAANAITYARAYALNYNLNYPNYNVLYGAILGDCTNFVSRCLFAGGVSMDGFNNTTGTYSSTNEWYCNYTGGSLGIRLYALTTSWINADDFFVYMTSRANKRTFAQTVDDVYTNCRPGDVVQLIKRADGNVSHSIIITSKDASTAKFCGHTTDRKDASIYQYLDETKYSFVIFSFRPEAASGGPIDECGQCGEIPRDYYTQFHSASLDCVIECPTHQTHDAEVYQHRYDAYCSVHDNYVGSIYETVYVCLSH